MLERPLNVFTTWLIACQIFFKTGKIPNRAELHKVLGTDNQNVHYKAFYSDTAQQILTGIAESRIPRLVKTSVSKA